MEVGERNLEELLRRMDPALAPGEFVFAAGPLPEGVDPLCRFREPEGVTYILDRADAERLGIQFTYPCRMITLRVHSSLEAVGFLARIAAELARRGISVNVVSAFHHDHLFVPADRAGETVAALREMAAMHSGGAPPCTST
jgi:uncharacterized protein